MIRSRRFAWLFIFSCLLSASTLQAQAPPDFSDPPKFGLQDPLGGINPLGGGADTVLLDAYFQMEKGSQNGKLSITAIPEEGFHIYALTQPKGGSKPTVIKVSDSPQFKLTGNFTPDHNPKKHYSEVFKIEEQEHDKKVTWTAPIVLTEGVDPQKLTIEVKVTGQVCDESGCNDYGGDKQAVFTDYYEPAVAGPFRPEKSHVTLEGYIEPKTTQPGGKVKLVIQATPEKPYHIYHRTDVEPEELGNRPTLIAFKNLGSWKIGNPKVISSDEKETGDTKKHKYYEEPVQWEFEIEIPKDAKEGQLIEGLIGFQTCTQSCDMPDGAAFQVTIVVGDSAIGGRVPLAFSPSSYSKASDLAADFSERQKEAHKKQNEFWATTFVKLGFSQEKGKWSHWLLPNMAMSRGTLIVLAVTLIALAGLLGGMILNVMPCVLPVIGLKIMSFVQQAGESRWRVFSLNLWYSVGVLLVFMVLAGIVAALHVGVGQTIGADQKTFGWGDMLRTPSFSIPLIAIIFTLSLSLLGVWEIPIPGFVGSGKASELSQKEGPMGAVFKGVLTTLLATPCSGPFIGFVVGIAVAAPIWLNFTIFFFMALGMALPFLVIGIFPKLIALLPRPGAWMETFKQAMGFVLLGTAVWVFFSLNSIEKEYVKKGVEGSFVMPTLVLMTILGLGCWIVGRVPVTAERWQKIKSWLVAAIFILSTILILFVKWSYIVPLVAMVDGLLLAGWLVWQSRKYNTMRRKVGIIATSAATLLIAVGVAYMALKMTPLDWETFSRAKLDKYRQQGYTVLVDFTADW